MLYAKQIRQNLLFTALSECMDMRIEHAPMEHTKLYDIWDKAARTVVTRTAPELKPVIEQALLDLSTHSKSPLPEKALPAAIEKLHRFHARVARLAEPGATIPAYEPDAIPAKDFERFYSLVYHLIPRHKQYDAERYALVQLFKQLDTELLPREAVCKHLSEILTLSDKKLGQGRN